MDLFRRPGRKDADKEERFDRLYRENYGRVLAYALRRATPDIAHDVVADTFLVAWRRLERVPAEPLPWLLGVARKTLANHRRGAQRRQSLLAELKSHTPTAPLPESDASVAVGDVVAALERLSETDQELIKLIAWEGLEAHEAATVLGISAAACRVRLHRARRRLAQELGGEEVRARTDTPFLNIAKESR